jgi:hypothetical protein
MRNPGSDGSVQGDMGKHRWLALAVGLVLTLPTVAACATPTGADRPGDSAGVESDPATSGSSSGSPGNPGGGMDPTKGPGEENPGDMPPGTPKTLRGAASDGVEAGCIVFQADDGNVYQLLGGDRELILSSARLEVSVLIQPDLMTTCQQGIPAQVLSVRKI